MTDNEIESCPFCGGEELTNNGHCIECDKCHAQGPDFYPVPNSELALEAWNKRTEIDPDMVIKMPPKKVTRYIMTEVKD